MEVPHREDLEQLFRMTQKGRETFPPYGEIHGVKRVTQRYTVLCACVCGMVPDYPLREQWAL